MKNIVKAWTSFLFVGHVVLNVLISFVLSFYAVLYLWFQSNETHCYNLLGNIILFSIWIAACLYTLPMLFWSVFVFPRNSESKYNAWLFRKGKPTDNKAVEQ